MLEIVSQNILNIILDIFLKKYLFKKIVIYFIDNTIMVLSMKLLIIWIETANLQ